MNTDPIGKKSGRSPRDNFRVQSVLDLWLLLAGFGGFDHHFGMVFEQRRIRRGILQPSLDSVYIEQALFSLNGAELSKEHAPLHHG